MSRPIKGIPASVTDRIAEYLKHAPGGAVSNSACMRWARESASAARVEAFREAARVEPASVRCPIHTAVPVGAPCFWGYCCYDRWRAAIRQRAEAEERGS